MSDPAAPRKAEPELWTCGICWHKFKTPAGARLECPKCHGIAPPAHGTPAGERCEGRYSALKTLPPFSPPYELTFRCGLAVGHKGLHAPEPPRSDSVGRTIECEAIPAAPPAPEPASAPERLEKLADGCLADLQALEADFDTWKIGEPYPESAKAVILRWLRAALEPEREEQP